MHGDGLRRSSRTRPMHLQRMFPHPCGWHVVRVSAARSAFVSNACIPCNHMEHQGEFPMIQIKKHHPMRARKTIGTTCVEEERVEKTHEESGKRQSGDKRWRKHAIESHAWN